MNTAVPISSSLSMTMPAMGITCPCFSVSAQKPIHIANMRIITNNPRCTAHRTKQKNRTRGVQCGKPARFNRLAQIFDRMRSGLLPGFENVKV